MAGIILQNSATASEMGIDNRSAHVALYDSSGNILTPVDKAPSGITPGATRGVPIMGAEWLTPRLLRSLTDGALAGAEPTLLLEDNVEGAAVNTNKWIQTTTTMTIAQATGVITFNSGSSAATTVGAMHTSHRFLPYPSRGRLIMRGRFRATAHFNNNLHEIGFGTPTSATAAGIGVGACWRKDGTGQWLPVISSSNGTEVLGTPISDATWTASIPAANFFTLEVEVTDRHFIFRAYTSVGVLVNEQDIPHAATTGNMTGTRLQTLVRTYNNAGTGTAVQLLAGAIGVWCLDYDTGKPWNHCMAGEAQSSLTSPTAYTQTANSANNTTPTSRTLSNTAAGETTLGGDIVATAMVAATTDLIMFGFQVPSPYTFYFTGIKISVPLNQVVAVATTETLFQYGMAFNSSAVSLATAGVYPPMRIQLPGYHNAIVALAANKPFSIGTEIAWSPATPIVVFPGRFLHVFTRCLVGTATATETYRWGVTIDGYFE